MQQKSHYRPEIDGLRALAIIPVILFHAGIAGFTGGFIGVDIFFVISGFLITAIILREMQEGTFSMVKFWERRMRRIVPALFVITTTVLIAAYFIVLFPVDFIDFGQSLVAQSIFLANIFFMRKHAYFAAPSESMPLLHTWSLSVEEQFYIGFPIVLFLIWFVTKKIHHRGIALILTVIAIASFVYNIYLVELHPGAAFSLPLISYIWGAATNLNAGFFFIFARAWELLIGAILAVGAFSITNRFLAEAVSYTGIAAILFAVVSLDSSTPFPGFAALLPTLGTAFVIVSNTRIKTSVGQLLSFPVIVGVGLVSYSLYLWHWPLIVFTKTLFGAHEYIYLYLLSALGLSLILSVLTYAYIETPFRKRIFFPKTWQMFLFGFAALFVLGASGLAIHFGNGFPGRASETAGAIAAAAVDVNPREFDCFRKNYREVFALGEPCLLGDQTDTEQIDFVLWGDSHSDAAMPVIDAMALEYGQTGAFFGAGGCRPLMWEGVTTSDERCKQIKNAAIEYINAKNVHKVLFISSWESDPQKSGATRLGLMGGGIDESQVQAVSETFYDALAHTVALVSGSDREIYIMERVPIYNEYNVRQAFTEAALSHEAYIPITQTRAEYDDLNGDANRAIDQLAEEGMITVIDPTTILCKENVCSMAYKDQILYKDGAHINTTGAMRLRPIFEDFFSG